METCADSLALAGFIPLTTLDYPDHLACVVFTQGCPLRCGYCKHPQMLDLQAPPSGPSWVFLRSFLQQQRGMLQAVVFSGGEPTLQPALIEALRESAALGYKVGLHTSGIYPARLAEALPYLSWVALDIKTLEEKYDQVCGVAGCYAQVESSLQLLLDSGVEYEVRITLHPQDFDLADLAILLERLYRQGVRHCVLQLARAEQCLNPAYEQLHDPFHPGHLQELIKHAHPGFARLELRYG